MDTRVFGRSGLKFSILGFGCGPVGGLIFAVNMLVNTDSGGTFSFEEISEWLGEAGFTGARTIDTHGP